MRKALTIILSLALVVGAMAATPAQAAKKKKKKPKAVVTTLYAHGSMPFGELEIPDAVNGVYMTMDKNEPSGGQPKSMGFTHYVGGPNPNCAGNFLFPVFVGDVSGTITGDITVTLNTLAIPGSQVDVRVWPDITALSCNDAYPTPAGEVRVDLPAGQGTTEAKIEGVNFPVAAKMMLQVTPVIGGTTQGRLLYDASSAATSISFSCIPASGTSCTP